MAGKAKTTTAAKAPKAKAEKVVAPVVAAPAVVAELSVVEIPEEFEITLADPADICINGVLNRLKRGNHKVNKQVYTLLLEAGRI